MLDTWTRPDIKIRYVYLYLERHRSHSRLRIIYNFAVRIKYFVARILINTLLRILQNLVGSLLTSEILPIFTDTVSLSLLSPPSLATVFLENLL